MFEMNPQSRAEVLNRRSVFMACEINDTVAASGNRDETVLINKNTAP